MIEWKWCFPYQFFTFPSAFFFVIHRRRCMHHMEVHFFPPDVCCITVCTLLVQSTWIGSLFRWWCSSFSASNMNLFITRSMYYSRIVIIWPRKWFLPQNMCRVCRYILAVLGAWDGKYAEHQKSRLFTFSIHCSFCYRFFTFTLSLSSSPAPLVIQSPICGWLDADKSVSLRFGSNRKTKTYFTE